MDTCACEISPVVESVERASGWIDAKALGAVVLIGVGNETRGDDGVGPYVVSRLRRIGLPISLVECSGDTGELLDAWRNRDTAFVVDAVLSGRAPGAIVRFALPEDSVPAIFVSHMSSHSVGLADTIAMGQALGEMPRRLVVVGVEGSRFGIGEPMSPVVRESCDEVVALLHTELKQLTLPTKSRKRVAGHA